MNTAALLYEELLRFVDEIVIKVCGGNGGSGVTSFHRAKYLPKGGPDGGDGGHGGDVILRASTQLGTLEDASLRNIIRAENGTAGQGGRKRGRNGSHKVIDLPIGTLVWDEESKRLFADLSEEGQQFTIVRGGRGGFGNARFATSTNRAPRKCTPGKSGEERQIRLELKLLADVGLVGRPNAGKSTLLAKLTRAKPHIGDYPFSTLSPALGIVNYGIYQRFIIADIPGLAEGAHEGRGLGHQFLRHIERTRLLVLMIEAEETDYQSAYNQLVDELEGFGGDLTALPRITTMSKSDLFTSEDRNDDFQFDLKISSITGEGLDELVDLMAEKLGLEKEGAGRIK